MNVSICCFKVYCKRSPARCLDVSMLQVVILGVNSWRDALSAAGRRQYNSKLCLNPGTAPPIYEHRAALNQAIRRALGWSFYLLNAALHGTSSGFNITPTPDIASRDRRPATRCQEIAERVVGTSERARSVAGTFSCPTELASLKPFFSWVEKHAWQQSPLPPHVT